MYSPQQDDDDDDDVSIPLIHVDILPQPSPHDKAQEPSFLAAAVKLFLRKASLANRILKTTTNDSRQQAHLVLTLTEEPSSSTGLLLIQGALSCDASSASDDDDDDSTVPVLLLPQNNIVLPSTWPCKCLGFIDGACLSNTVKNDTAAVVAPHKTVVRVHVTASTTVHVLTNDAAQQPLTPLQAPLLSAALVDEVCTNHNPETVRELSLRLRQLWARQVLIGNTRHALDCHWRQEKRRKAFAKMFAKAREPCAFACPESGTPFSLNDESSFLLVHSPDHGAGKSLLVQSLVQRIQPNAALHVIPSATLLATTGVAADAALESQLHCLAYTAALNQQPACVVLDDLQALLPSSGAGGDAAMPVLHALTAYLRVLARRISQEGIFPFPTKNPLYNLCNHDGDAASSSSSNNSTGHVLSVRFLCVGILTCPDHGNKSGKETTRFPLDTLGTQASKYRVPTLTAATRHAALHSALERTGVVLAGDALSMLPRLAASAVGARGPAFGQIAQSLCQYNNKDNPCSAEQLRIALAKWGRAAGDTSTTVSFESPSSSTGGSADDLFASVGGNTQAKLALHEALSLDPKRRALLASFGLSPPRGIMLFGPPGCGKTLMAKAVAKMLQNQSASSVGGAFVSLSSSDLVHAEVGTGEKLLVSAFETARMNAPSVVFIDEFQALFTDRSTSGGSSRFSSTLLSLLDDIGRWEIADHQANSPPILMEDGTSSQRVVVMAATNTPWMVDSAFLRPGRFDHVVHVGLPDFLDRQKIFELLIGKMKTTFSSANAVRSFSRQLAEATEGYSGADISVVCRTAAVDCLVASEDLVTEQHLLSALNQVKASSSPELVDRISNWKL